MKKFYYLFYIVALLCSCSENLLVVENTINERTLNSSHITQENALEIANKVIGLQNTSLSRTLNTPTFDYVINTNKSRSTQSTTDTLAYVINYPNDGGFVIVSSSNLVYPVLAFSNEGNFSFSNEVSKTNFIDNIGAYLAEASENSTYEVGDNDFDSCYVVSPIVKTCLSQGYPWNKYVIQENPGCPVGCVAVATALVMTHSKYHLAYHGTDFPFKSIVDAIATGNEEPDARNSSSSSDKASGRPSVTPSILAEYTYEQAVDSMAKILYWIGKDVDMTYATNGSSAYSYDAYMLCCNLGFTIPSGYASFDIEEITRYLKDGNIVYLRGQDINGAGGHAWVCDGCYFCIDYSDPSVILDTYVHCDWGWGGNSNGYYSGSVFSASSYNFTPQHYFAIQREW